MKQETSREAENGYRELGLREVRKREWASLQVGRHEPAPTPEAFDQLVRTLQENRRNGIVYRCESRDCTREWSPIEHIPSHLPRYCSDVCRKRRLKRGSYKRRKLCRAQERIIMTICERYGEEDAYRSVRQLALHFDDTHSGGYRRTFRVVRRLVKCGFLEMTADGLQPTGKLFDFLEV